MAATGLTGWYCSVLQEGLIEPGTPVFLVELPYSRWTMALINDFGHGRNHDLDIARQIASCPLLNEFWQELVVRRGLGKG